MGPRRPHLRADQFFVLSAPGYGTEMRHPANLCALNGPIPLSHLLMLRSLQRDLRKWGWKDPADIWAKTHSVEARDSSAAVEPGLWGDR